MTDALQDRLSKMAIFTSADVARECEAAFISGATAAGCVSVRVQDNLARAASAYADLVRSQMNGQALDHLQSQPSNIRVRER